MPYTIQVSGDDGETVSYEIEPDAHGLMTVEDVNSNYVPLQKYNSEMAGNRKKLKAYEDHVTVEEARAKILEEADDAFKAEALQKWGVDPKSIDKDLSARYAQQLETEKKKWFKANVPQRDEMIEQLQRERDVLRRSQLHTEILQSVGSRVLPSLVTGDEPMILGMLENRFRWDDEAGGWARYDNNGVVYSGKANSAGNPMRVSEYLNDHWLSESVNESLLADQRQSGSGVRASGVASASDASGRVHRITAEQARDASAYNRARAAADKAGVPLEVVDDRAVGIG